MKKIFLVFLPFLILAATVFVPVEWDNSSIRSFKGTITYIQKNVAVFEANGVKYELHTGPSRYLLKHGIVLKVGSKLEVTGMVVKVRNRYYIFAQRIKYGGKALNIRDKDGKPLWRMGKGRRPSL